MRIPRNRRQHGIALIIVMIVIVVLGILAGGFAYTMKVETKLARNATFDTEFEWLGRSGIELARYVLSVEGQGPMGQFDGLNQKWAGGPGDSNGPLAEIDLTHYELPQGSGRFIAVKIVDQERKFNINIADEIVLRQAMTLVGIDASQIPTIVDSILDWRDRDDNTHPSGAESSDYQAMNPPYFAKNGPFDDLTELLMVRGVTPQMYWGSSGGGSRTVVFNKPNNARRSQFDEPTYAVGLSELFTTLSGRLLNVNTASANTLRVMPEIDDALAQAIITARNGLDGAPGTEDDTPFRGVQELVRVPGMNPAVVPQLTRYFSTKSLIFEAQVTVHIGPDTRVYTAMIRRNDPRNTQILFMNWKRGSAGS